MPSGRLGDPGGQAQLVQRARRPRSSSSGSNSAMFSASVPARISVRCGTIAIHRRSPSTSRSSRSVPPRNTVPRGTSTARVSTLARVDLPDPVRPIRAYERPRAKVRLTSRSAGRAPGVGLAVAEGQVRAPRGRRRPAASPPAGSCGDVLQQLHPAPGAERVLQLRHHPADVLDGAAEAEREQPDGGQPGAVDPAGGQRPGAADHDQRAMPARIIAGGRRR